MKKEFSNNQLITIAVVAIALSLFSLFLSVGKLGITGAIVTTGEGYVNVTVPAVAGIVVHMKSINFTATNPGDYKTSYAATNVSTVDGLPCNVDNHCGMNISNSGSVFVNITIYEDATTKLFTSGSYDNNSHFLYNVTMQDPQYTTGYSGNGNCSVGYSKGLKGPGPGGAVGQWRGVPRGSGAAELAICYLNWSSNVADTSDSRPDIARVEFNITVPDGEPAGDKVSIIHFSAVDATP